MASICFCVAFNAVNFSFVSCTRLVNTSCFCASNVVLVGFNFKAWSTSFSSFSVAFSFSLTFLILSSSSCIFIFDALFACAVKFFNWLSATMICRLNFWYSWLFLSTPAASIFFCASFNAFNLSLVSVTRFDNSSCFCARSVVFVGLNFSALFTSFSERFVDLDSLLIFLNALSNFVVSPRNSIVIPLISPAIFSPHLKEVIPVRLCRFPCSYGSFQLCILVHMCVVPFQDEIYDLSDIHLFHSVKIQSPVNPCDDHIFQIYSFA